jgi:predicted nicotinamide N-methyase
VGRLHAGIDIPAGEGTPIRAAAAGPVAFTQSEGSSGGYGNYTCIQHGGGISTCYAHQSSFGTSSGARVSQGQSLRTPTGEVPLDEYHLRLGDRTWTVQHTGAVLSFMDEQRFLSERPTRPPYGVALWPAAIARAHESASRTDVGRGVRVLELGAGTGLPGIVAATLGATVVQTDRHELALALCRSNGQRNAATAIEYRLADWTSWTDSGRYACILGSDILYAERLHPDLCRIFDRNLAPGGRLLLSDPFRSPSVRLLEAMEAEGWSVSVSKWSVEGEAEPRPIGIYELTR